MPIEKQTPAFALDQIQREMDETRLKLIGLDAYPQAKRSKSEDLCPRPTRSYPKSDVVDRKTRAEFAVSEVAKYVDRKNSSDELMRVITRAYDPLPQYQPPPNPIVRTNELLAKLHREMDELGKAVTDQGKIHREQMNLMAKLVELASEGGAIQEAATRKSLSIAKWSLWIAVLALAGTFAGVLVAL